MTKKGFTLTEVLITVGVVGIIAALVLPGVISTLPCENKVKFVKAYSSLTNTVQSFASDEEYYYNYDATTGIYKGLGTLDTTGKPTANEQFGIGDSTDANTKLATLVASRLHTTSTVTSPLTTFTTVDGTRWSFVKGTDTIVSTVTIDVDPDNKNKMKHEFILNIDKYGAVMPNSNCEKNLIATPSDLKKASFNAACP